jgi:hypothetical protein
MADDKRRSSAPPKSSRPAKKSHLSSADRRLYCSYADDAFTKLETEPEVISEVGGIDGDITKVGDKFLLLLITRCCVGIGEAAYGEESAQNCSFGISTSSRTLVSNAVIIARERRP